MVHRGLTYRLIPGTKVRAEQLAQLAGACRYVWNEILRYQQQLYEVYFMHNATPPSTSAFTFFRYFTVLRAQTPWLQELSFATVRHTLKYLADAYQEFFQGTRGFPKFKSKRGNDSFTIGWNVKIKPCGRDQQLYIPKVGWFVLKRRSHPYPDAQPINATVRQECGKWYCSVTYEVDLPEQRDNGLAVGIDRNVGQIGVSTGEIIDLPNTRTLEAKVKRYQRMMARRQKGSNRRKKARYLCAKTQCKLANQRENWCHQTSRVLANTASEVVIEDLNTKGMTASAKGMVDEPGKNVKAKSGLNREINKSGWYKLESYLGYKAYTLTKIPAKHTSLKCNACGHVDKENRKTQAQFQCVSCGHSGNADINAALNILASGIGASGRRGALTLVTPMNRQMIGFLHFV